MQLWNAGAAPAGDEQQSLEKFELWLRTMIHESWEIYFEGVPDESGDPNPDQFSEQANLLHEDAASLFETLVDLQAHSTYMSRLLRPIGDDVFCFSMLTSLWVLVEDRLWMPTSSLLSALNIYLVGAKEYL